MGEEGRRRKPGRKGPGRQSWEREGQVPACWGQDPAEAGSELQGPWDGRFSLCLSPDPLSSAFRFPPPTTHLRKLHPPSSPLTRPPLPPFPLILGSEGGQVFELRMEEGAGGEGAGQNNSLQLHQARPAPPPAARRQSYNIHEAHEYAVCSLWGWGLLGSASPFTIPRGLPGEEAVVWGRRGPPDVEPDEGGGEPVAVGGRSHRGARGWGDLLREDPRSLEPQSHHRGSCWGPRRPGFRVALSRGPFWPGWE